MHRARVDRRVARRTSRREQTLVHSLADIRRERGLSLAQSSSRTHHRETQGQQSLVQGVQRRPGVVFTTLALETPAVEADVPVCQVVDQVEETRDDGVEAVGLSQRSPHNARTCHFLAHELDERLASSKDPAVHHVCRPRSIVVISERLASACEKLNLTKVEVE